MSVGERLKMIAPRCSTPAPGDSQSTDRLPDDLFAEQIRRVALFSVVGIGLWTFGLSMDSFFLPIASPSLMISSRAVTIEVVGIATSLVMGLYARYASHTAKIKADASVAYMMINAALIAALNTWATVPTVETMNRLSWFTVLILVFSMITPTTPGRMLTASLIAATMDPVGVWLAHLRGEVVPPALTVLIYSLPNYVCAVVATLPSHVMQGMGRRLREAQAMGSYQLVELLGHGGMGEVWRARHRLLARGAAIKLIRPEVLGVADANHARVLLRRFEREAQATAALSSPHTIDLFDYGMTDEGTFYYVMELLQGRDLDSLVREFGPLTADRTIFLMRQVCHSLADAHARGLVHRDIKPANIYVCRMGLEYDFVKVLDFGLVKFGDPTSMKTTLMTSDHTTTGTPAFMAPEVILGDSEVDRRADVYALGCVAYYLLTGRLVFEAETSMKMLLQHVNAVPVPPSQRTELRIPPEMDALVLSCLEKDPEKRPQDAGELFRIACACGSCNSWNHDRARAWWEQHLPELTGPLTIDALTPDVAAQTIVN